jgi:hypothetical protein
MSLPNTSVDVEQWERERLLEALECYKHGTSEAPSLRKWSALSQGSAAQEGPAGTMTFVASTDDVDRHGDTIAQSGWKLDAYKKNPVFLWAHHYTQPAIGKALDVWVADHSLLAAIRFAPTEFAQEIATLVPAGVPERRIGEVQAPEFEMRRDTKTGQVASINFTRQELLEISAAPVPANQNALRKGLDGTPRMKDYYLALEGSNSELEDILEVLRSAMR